MVALAGGEDIKCAKYATYGTRQLSKNILKALKDRKACLISNHGQIVFDENLPKAFELAEEVEKSFFAVYNGPENWTTKDSFKKRNE